MFALGHVGRAGGRGEHRRWHETWPLIDSDEARQENNLATWFLSTASLLSDPRQTVTGGKKMEPMLIADPEGWDEFVSTLSFMHLEEEPLAYLTAMIHCVNQNLDNGSDVGRTRITAELAEVLANAIRNYADAIEEEERAHKDRRGA